MSVVLFVLVAVLVVVAWFLIYLYGVKVGLHAGRDQGRAAAERELAHLLEMGAL